LDIKIIFVQNPMCHKQTYLIFSDRYLPTSYLRAPDGRKKEPRVIDG
jgi:hypothetical protein